MEQSGEIVYVEVGDTLRVRLPWSEVCIHMRVAGKPMTVQIVGEPQHPMAQLLHEDGSPFSSPILLGEAGVYSDGPRYYVPARNIASVPEPHTLI